MTTTATSFSGRRRRFAPLLVATLLAACAGGGSDDASPSDTAAPVDDSEPAATAEPGDTEAPATDTGTDTDTEPATSEAPEQLTSEGEGSDADLEPQAGGVLRVGLSADGTGFNTIAAISPGSSRIINAMNDSLVAFDEAGETAPWLAEAVEPSDDFLTWTITLRPDVRFHDGVAVDAAAVKANLDAFRGSPAVGYGMGLVTDISVVDDLTVEVTMSSPWVAFDNYLAGQPGYMVSPATIGTNDDFVGTGPFVLDAWSPGDSARVVRNDDYWRDDLPYLDAVEFKFISDPTVRRQALEAGDIDVYTNANDFDILEFLDDPDVDVWIGEGTSNESLFLLNTAAPPFDDVRVRRAMAYAIDRELVIDIIRSGLTTPADGPFEPSSRWYTETDYPGYDPEEAIRLVDEYEAENGPISFTLKGEPSAQSEELRDLVVSFWQDAGLDVTQEEIGLGTSVSTVIGDDFQAIVWAQFNSGDPDGEYSFFRSGGPLNWTNFVDERLDAALDLGRSTGDFDARYAAYAEFQEILASEVPIVWIDHLGGVESVASIPTVHNIAERTLPNGEPGIALLAGSFFSYEDVWIEQ